MPRPVTWSPPHTAGEVGRGLGRNRLDRTSQGGEERMSLFPAKITTLESWDCREEVRVHMGVDVGCSLRGSCGFGTP